MKRRPTSTVRVHESGLAAFREYLLEQGLTAGTADEYVRDVKNAVAAGGIVKRLTDDARAPKSRWRLLSAARSWADFADDAALAKHLRRFKLPAARRKGAKTPLARDQLLAFCDELTRCEYLQTPLVGVLGMMARRGFRVGDVLRIRREELVAAKEGGTLSYLGKGRRRLEFKVIKTYRRYLELLASRDGDWDTVADLISPDAKNPHKAAKQVVARALVKVGSRAGVYGRLHPHRLRRTYAVEYLRALQGDPEGLMKLQQHMQWASATTAMEYVDHARGDELDKVAERMFDR